MTDELYPRELVRLAKDATKVGGLGDPHGTATLDNPFCGDRVSFDVRLDSRRRIVAIRHRVQACVLCQATTVLLTQRAIGRSCADIEALGDALIDGLTLGAAHLVAGDPGLDILKSVACHRLRFACVMLPFDTLETAAKAAGEDCLVSHDRPREVAHRK